MSQLPDLPDATTAADGDKLLKRDTSTGTDEGLTVSLLRDEIAGKTVGDLAQYEDDGSGNAALGIYHGTSSYRLVPDANGTLMLEDY